MKFLPFLVLLMLASTICAQRDSLFFTNSSVWDEERYPDVQGTPYFFEDFVIADITRRDSFVFRDVKLNFNGFTNEFEIRQEEKFIILEALWYREISISKAKNPNLSRDVVFRQDVHPSYKAKFTEVLYAGEKLTMIHDFTVDKTEKTIQNVGKAVTFERFVPVSTFKLIQGMDIKILRPKKDVLAKTLGHEKEFYKFLKESKIKKLNEKENLARAAAWYDTKL